MKGIAIRPEETHKKESHLLRNLAYAALSIAGAILLAHLGAFETILHYSRSVALLGNFIAGFFFTSILTMGPAAVALEEIATTSPVVLVAFIGALGGTIGDTILFLFLRDRVDNNFVTLFERPKIKRWVHILHLEVFRWTLPFVGALLLASPLPDEVGLSVMGFARVRFATFFFFSYAMNFVNIILIVGLIRVMIG